MFVYNGKIPSHPNYCEYNRSVDILKLKIENNLSLRVCTLLFNQVAGYFQSLVTKFVEHDKSWVLKNIDIFLDEIKNIQSLFDVLREDAKKADHTIYVNYHKANNILEITKKYFVDLQDLHNPKSVDPQPRPSNIPETHSSINESIKNCCSHHCYIL